MRRWHHHPHWYAIHTSIENFSWNSAIPSGACVVCLIVFVRVSYWFSKKWCVSNFFFLNKHHKKGRTSHRLFPFCFFLMGKCQPPPIFKCFVSVITGDALNEYDRLLKLGKEGIRVADLQPLSTCRQTAT